MEQPSVVTWIGIVLAYLGVSAVGFILLFYLARRELSGRRAVPVAELTRALEARVARMITHPPDWRIWKRPRARKVLLSAASAALAALAVGALWRHAGTWFAHEAAARPVDSVPNLPFESLIGSVMRSSMWTVVSATSIVASGAAFLFGEHRKGVALFAAALVCFGMPRAAEFAFADTASAYVLSTAEPPSTAAAPATSQESQADSHQTDSAEQAEPSKMLQSAAAPSAKDQSHFGVTDALLLYGLYRAATDDESTHAWSHAQQQTSSVRAGVSQAAALRSATPQAVPLKVAATHPEAPSRAVVQRGPSTYKPFTGRVSSFGKATRTRH